MPTKTKVYIQHIFKEFKSLGKQLGKIHPNDSSKIVKMYQRTRIPLQKHNTEYIFTKKKKKEMCPDTTEPSYQLRHQKARDEYQASQQ
jgi:hypothetical protein